MVLLPDTWNCALRMRQECRKRFPDTDFKRKSLVNNPCMHPGTCVTHVPWCMSRSLICGGGENVSGIPGACAARNFMYLVRGPWKKTSSREQKIINSELGYSVQINWQAWNKGRPLMKRLTRNQLWYRKGDRKRMTLICCASSQLHKRLHFHQHVIMLL